MPSNMGTEDCASPLTAHVPGMFDLLFANGPISAMVPDFFKGKMLLLFFNNTQERAANWRAAVRLSALKTSLTARSALMYRKGSSNNPSLYFASRILRQASSIFFCVILFCCKDFFNVV